jgi:hypothetical protein
MGHANGDILDYAKPFPDAEAIPPDRRSPVWTSDPLPPNGASNW